MSMHSDLDLLRKVLLLLVSAAWLADCLRCLRRARLDGDMPPSRRLRLLVATVLLSAAVLLMLLNVIYPPAFRPVLAR